MVENAGLTLLVKGKITVNTVEELVKFVKKLGPGAVLEAQILLPRFQDLFSGRASLNALQKFDPRLAKEVRRVKKALKAIDKILAEHQSKVVKDD